MAGSGLVDKFQTVKVPNRDITSPARRTVVAKKQTRQASEGRVAEGFRLARWLTHPFVVFVGATLGIMVTASWLWEEYGESFPDHARYALSPEKIELPPANEWVPGQPEVHLAEQLNAQGLNLLSKDLVEIAAEQFCRLPYVDTIRRIEKSADGLKIDVAFRQPVGLLDLGNGRYQRLDRQAVQIGQPLVVTEESADWLRINVHQPRVEGGEWSRVEDERIERAAEICRDLQSSWKELGLYRVVFYWPAGTPVSDETPFEVWTANGSRVLWCNGNPQSRPATGQQKIDALRNWIAVNGPLEKLAGWRMIDVRSGQVLLVPETRTSFRPELGKRPY